MCTKLAPEQSGKSVVSKNCLTRLLVGGEGTKQLCSHALGCHLVLLQNEQQYISNVVFAYEPAQAFGARQKG